MLEIALCKRNLVFKLIGLNIQDISLTIGAKKFLKINKLL